MNSKNNSKSRQCHDEQWHQKNDHLIYSALMIIARPELAPAPSTDRKLVDELIGIFEQSRPPLEARDVVGLVILRLVSEFWPLGHARGLDAELATLQGFSLAAAIIPSRMRAAGFAVPMAIHPEAAPRLLMVQAQRVHHRWQEWHRKLLDPYSAPATERQAVTRELARGHCLRKATGERPAARKAAKLLDADLRRRGRGTANLDPEEVMAELYALDPGRIGETGILRLREDGQLHYDERSMRDALRKARLASLRSSMDPAEMATSPGVDPSAVAESAEQLAALLDRCDEIDRTIVENWEMPDVDLANQVELSPQAVGQRRRKIRSRAQELSGEPPE